MEDADWRNRMDAARIALVAAFTAGDKPAYAKANIRVRDLLLEVGQALRGNGTPKGQWVARTGSRPPTGWNIA